MVDRVAAHVDELKKQFPDQLWIGELDLSDLANIANTFRAAVQHFGRAVASNAGYSLLGAAEELQLDAIRHIVDTQSHRVNRTGAGNCGADTLGGGRLVQVSSGAGQAAFSRSIAPPSGASRVSSTRYIAQEVADFGIQTTLVEPGTIGQTLGPQVCSVLSWTPIAKARSVCRAR